MGQCFRTGKSKATPGTHNTGINQHGSPCNHVHYFKFPDSLHPRCTLNRLN